MDADRVEREMAGAIDRLLNKPLRPRKTPLPYGKQWVHHEKPGSRAALRRLRQMARDQGWAKDEGPTS